MSWSSPPFFFFFNDTATTEIYTLSLHDALPICGGLRLAYSNPMHLDDVAIDFPDRSEEHTSELQSPCNLVCRLLLEKKKTRVTTLVRALRRCQCLSKTTGPRDMRRDPVQTHPER